MGTTAPTQIKLGRKIKRRLITTLEEVEAHRHTQKIKGNIVCPFCHKEQHWRASSAAHMCISPSLVKGECYTMVKAYCEYCPGFFLVELDKSRKELEVRPLDAREWRSEEKRDVDECRVPELAPLPAQ